jgi:hypothetical protein
MMHRKLLLPLLLVSAHAVASESEMYVELARACSDETSVQNKLMLATAESMIDLTGQQACIDKTTRVGVTFTGIRTYKNRFGSEAVELTLTPKSSEQWVQLQKAWLLKEFVLIRGERSIVYGRVFQDVSEPNLTIFAKDGPEAKEIAGSLTVKVSDAK